MLRTIGLDNQLHLLANKIRNKRAKWLLFPKFKIAKLPIAKAAPEQPLLWRHLATELFCAFQGFGSISSHSFVVPPPLTKIF